MNRLRRGLAALVLIAPIAASPACKNKEELTPEQVAAKLQGDLTEARTRLKNGKVEDAQKIYLHILEKNPGQIDAEAGMGLVNYHNGNYEAAEALLIRATTAHPEDHELHFKLGHVYELTKRFEQAKASYARAYELDRDNSTYGMAYGKALKELKQWSEGEKVYREIGENDPMATFVFSDLGDCLREQGKLDEALKMYMKAQNTYRSDKMAHAGAGLVYELKGDIQHALDEWSSYIRQDCCSEYSNNVAKRKIATLQVPGGEAPQAAQAPAAGEAPAPAGADAAGGGGGAGGAGPAKAG